jgi:hypothetical protein
MLFYIRKGALCARNHRADSRTFCLQDSVIDQQQGQGLEVFEPYRVLGRRCRCTGFVCRACGQPFGLCFFFFDLLWAAGVGGQTGLSV